MTAETKTLRDLAHLHRKSTGRPNPRPYLTALALLVLIDGKVSCEFSVESLMLVYALEDAGIIERSDEKNTVNVRVAGRPRGLLLTKLGKRLMRNRLISWLPIVHVPRLMELMKEPELLSRRR